MSAILSVGLLVAGLTACGSGDPEIGTGTNLVSAAPAPTALVEPSPEPTLGASDPREPYLPTVAAEITGIEATGLVVPWGLATLPDGTVLITERSSHRVLLDSVNANPVALTGPGAEDLVGSTTGEGAAGLLGVAVCSTFNEDHLVFFFRTAVDGNQVVRGELNGTVLGTLSPILSKIPSGNIDNGGQVACGPDGYLYVATGDAGSTILAQHPDSLAGKILRVAADGSIPVDNPIPGSPLWSLGHRNVEGMAWSADGRLFASEMGADTFDELNLIVSGGNYGWPAHEGPGGVSDGFIDPLVTWVTGTASPSGLAVTDEAVYVAGMDGEALLRVPLALDGVGEPQRLLSGAVGRLRAVVAAGDGTLLLLTSNTDGSGVSREGDDVLAVVTLVGQ